MFRVPRRLAPALLVALCSVAAGADSGRNPADDLAATFPGVRFYQEEGRLQIVYGVPMTAGADARAAANTWIAAHGQVFGCGALSVAEDWSTPFEDNRHTVFTFQQFIGGVPVEYGVLKVLVLNQPTPRVVYAAGTLAPAPADGAFPAPLVTGADALLSIQNLPAWKSYAVWSAPTLAVWQGNGDWVAPVLTWKFTGENPSPAAAGCRTFFIDALTGALVATRNEVVNDDVSGTIQGRGSPGVLPDAPYNLPVLLNMPNMRAAIAGGNSAFTSPAGAFSIPNAGTTPVDVSCGIAQAAGAGQWVYIVPGSGATALTAGLTGVLPPGPADLALNPTPSEHLTAQINAFIGIALTHNYFRDRAPAFTGIDFMLCCNTSVTASCNANFSAGASPPTSSSITTYRAGSGCANFGYSTILSHEYGHFIVNRLGLAQNAFGEGFGDTMGQMVWDDRVNGRGAYGQNTIVRDPIASNTNVQYPCSNVDPHFCGMVLSGVWWRIRTNMGNVYGSGPGLAAARALNVKWALLTLGGPNSFNAAGPGTAIEALTADDNDGNLSNGTPNYPQICPAFAAHNIPCPPTTTPPCYPNCDGSMTVPVLNISDFTCFANRFAAGDLYANCDGSSLTPVLNVSDFICFLNKYTAGCP